MAIQGLQRMRNERSHTSARNVKQVKLTPDQALHFASNPQLLNSHGFALDSSSLSEMARLCAMDETPQGLNPTIASGAVPIQFLQNWLVGQVWNVTAVRKIDTLIGITTQGLWHEQEVVQTILERTGEAMPYSDYGNFQLADYNPNFERRTIVRNEIGLQVGVQEEATAAAIQINAAEAKRAGVTNALEINRNAIGFYGFNDGLARTFGFLNDPLLLPFIEVAAGASGSTKWNMKTFQEIKNDLLQMSQEIRIQSQGLIDPEKTPCTLALALSVQSYLAQTTDFGISVLDWIKTNYPNWRIESAPELDNANGGEPANPENVGYLYADEVDGTGTDDNRTFIQVVPAKMITLGVQQKTKSYEEDYSNATAGTMCKRPYAVVRFSGI